MAIFKTRPLNDRTNGFRFDVMGFKGVYRKRKTQSRKLSIDSSGETFIAIHMGKRSLYLEQRNPARKLYDFALRNLNNVERKGK